MRYLALILLLGVTASLFSQNNSIALSQMKYAPAPNYAIITTTSGRQIYIEKDSFDLDTRLTAGWHSNDTLYLQVSRVSGQLPGAIDTIAIYIPAFGAVSAGTGISVTGTGTLVDPFVISNTAPDQTVTITGAGINSVSGTYPNFTITGTEVDGSVTNELQTLSISNDTLTISSGNSVVLPTGGGGVDTATFLQQDSILIYSVAGVEFGRDTIRTAGGGGSPCAIAAICPTYYDVTLAADGFGYVNTGMIDAGSLGGCDIASIEISDDNVNYGTYFLVDCTDLAGVTAYLKVTDQSSNTNTCSIAINVLDVNDPVIHCKDTVIYLDTTNITTITTAELYYVATASDNCGIDSVKIDSAGVLVDSIQLSVNGEYNFQLVAFDASLNLGYCTNHIRIGLNAGYIDFDTTYTNNYAEGRMKWNVDENSVEIGLSANLSGTALIDDYWYVKNQTGSPIAAGQLVYASGTLGTSGRILVSPYIANGTIDAKYVLGVVAETIPDGEDGYVITKGKLKGINTSAWPDGTVLWASTANAGNLTDTVPQAPNFRLPVAFVVHSASNGILAVRITTGSDLYEDHRVQVGSPTNGQLLRYDSTDQRWENWTPNFALQDTSGRNNYLAISNDTLFVGDDNDTLSVMLTNASVLQIVDITVTTDTVTTSDLGKLLRCNNAGAITLRIDTNANQPLPIGAVITVEQAGAGVVTITPISGVTINPTARKTWGQYSVIQLIKVGTNTWNVVGGSS